MIKVEICINSDTLINIRNSVGAAFAGGASTVELCSEMEFNGLTPPREHIIEARKAFHDRAGLMVMIRPRKGDFIYTAEELIIMHDQIKMAADSGADGVVFGLLDDRGYLQVAATRKLVETARSANMKITFHRAFDASLNPLDTLDALIDLGADRVLTSGVPWGQKGTALDGIDRLIQLINRSHGKIEIVVSGGINSEMVANVLKQLPLEDGKVSVHAYSGAQENGITTIAAVKSLIVAVSKF